MFGSFGGFIEAVQWHQFQTLKYQIESMRGHAAITGYVITELTDVHWEANGLLDLARNPRVFHDRFADINADVVLVPHLERWAFWAGDVIPIEVRSRQAGCTCAAAAPWSGGSPSRRDERSWPRSRLWEPRHR